MSDDKYWADEIQEILEGVIVNLKKLDDKIYSLEKDCNELLEECKELESIKYDVNLINDIVNNELKDDSRTSEGSM